MRTTSCTCDHCGKIIVLDKPGWAMVAVAVHPENKERNFDLCETCAATLLVDYMKVGSK